MATARSPPSLAYTIPKFVGTCSLGLLTGLSYTLSTTTVSPLLSFPTPTPAWSSFQSLTVLAHRQRRALTFISWFSLTLSWMLSPRAGRHPYLLWCASTALIGSRGVDWWFQDDMGREMEIWERERKARKEKDGVVRKEVASTEEEEVNGEVVREEMVGWRKREIVRGTWAGLGFLMGVVGIWGDGY
ncbi:hypothetical protein MMC25_001268 [Agyrium rufum]|nr:hypothetical protein [Agyrium rufum]